MTSGVSAAFIKELMRRSAQFYLLSERTGGLTQQDVEDALDEMLFAGGTLVVPSRFSAGAFWLAVRAHRVNWYSAVPTIHQVLLNRADADGAPRHSGFRFIHALQCRRQWNLLFLHVPASRPRHTRDAMRHDQRLQALLPMQPTPTL